MTTSAARSARMFADRIRDSAARGAALRIVGQGTWLNAGRPVRAAETISTRDYGGIVDYVPGDLTLTARAGTTFSEINAATAQHNQWLALDPHGTDDGTIGAAIATASSGPLSTGFGLPRDLVLGVEFVTGGGMVARGGGRVVKNVAGFDLTRLLTGSWGTLGIISEVSIRLHARPEADVTVGVSMSGGGGDASRVRQFLRRMPFTPFACEILNTAASRVVANQASPMAIFRLGGNGESVRAQRAALQELGLVAELDPALWIRLRTAEPDDAIVFRLSQLPSKLGECWNAAMRVAADCSDTLIHARPALGVVRCIVPRSDANVAALARMFAEPRTQTRIGERLPAALWDACAPSVANASLSRRIKATFDPSTVLNPGILGESN
jgi:glycolate oxidase FAD binding subunit